MGIRVPRLAIDYARLEPHDRDATVSFMGEQKFLKVCEVEMGSVLDYVRPIETHHLVHFGPPSPYWYRGFYAYGGHRWWSQSYLKHGPPPSSS